MDVPKAEIVEGHISCVFLRVSDVYQGACAMTGRLCPEHQETFGIFSDPIIPDWCPNKKGGHLED